MLNITLTFTVVRSTISHWSFVSVILLVLSCHSGEQPQHGQAENRDALFVRVLGSESGVSFVNSIKDTNEFNVFRYRNFYNGGGVAIGDINNDDLPDIFFTANMGQNRLYLNKGGFKFEDITESAGIGGKKPWDTGALMVDVNGDGFLDIYVSNAGNAEGDNHENDLFINNGDLTFTERSKEYNLSRSGFSTHAAFFDYDKDGDLDAYILNNSNVPVGSLGNAGDRTKKASEWESVPARLRGVGHMLLRNDNGKFVDVSDEAGIYGSLIAFGLGVMVSDVNGDTYPDIYVSNDFYERDYLYINQRDGTFNEEIEKWTSHLCLSAMGVDIADINNDGLNDIYVTDMLPETEVRTKSVMEFDTYDVFELKQSRGFYQQYIQNTLQLNNGNGTFSEIAYFSGVARTDWSWSALIFDMDNDGLRDIYVTNGIIHDLTDIDFVDFLANEVVKEISSSQDLSKTTAIIDKMPATPLANFAFRNNGDLTFKNVAMEWGLDLPSFSNGCAYGDLDLDGDLDLVVNNVNSEAFVFRNMSSEKTSNHYLQLQFKGEKGNTFAIGTSVKLFIKDRVMVQEVVPSRGFQSSMDYVMSMGLGNTDRIDSIRVVWPDNRVTWLRDVESNQRLILYQSDASDRWSPEVTRTPPTVFSALENPSLVGHQEDLFDDFNQEGLIIRQLSKEGPALAVGDVNSDGNVDVFIGGAKGTAGQVYLHTGNGNLKPAPSKSLVDDRGYEDTAASFFDVDGDTDLDLVVGSGGNISAERHTYLTRIYLNDGHGQFTRSTHELPSTKSNISVLVPYDYDNDGDVDLFVGSRSVPGVFGVDPAHLLLINNGDGKFTDGTDRYAYELKDAGMVTDATWTDVDGDGKRDLVVVSEWGAPLVMKNSGRRLSKWTSDLDSLRGWWNSVEAADLDGDGDPDLVLGNSGTNGPYVPSSSSPIKLWINDFDENGTIEQIMTSHTNKGDYPVHMRKELTTQLPHLKKENLKATDYAKRTIQEIISPDVVNASVLKSVTHAESIIAVNMGGGRFAVQKLPVRVQWSCVCGILCEDVNGDGQIDIVLGGNSYEYKPQFSRQDASYGHVLIGDGKLGFDWMDSSRSGFLVRDKIKHLAYFSDKNGGRYMIVAVNEGTPRVFRYKSSQP